MKKKFTFLLAALVLLGGLVGPMGKAKGQSITFTNLTEPSLSFSYGVGNEAPEGQYVYVSCANLGEGNDVTVSLGQGQDSHFELWDSESSQSSWINLTQFTATNTDPYWFGFGFLVRLKPGYEQDSEHSDVVNLTATVNGSTVSASITLTGTVTATTYNIEFDYGLNPHGWVAVYPSHDVVAGENVYMDVHPTSGYRFQSFTFYRKSNHEVVNSEDVSFYDLSDYLYADHEYTFMMPAYDLLIEASFVPNSSLPTPTIMVGTTPMAFYNGYGDPDPEGNFLWFGVQNPGNNSAIWAEVNSTDFELCQVTDPDAITWNGQYVGVQSTDASYFGFTLGVRLKPGLERGTYSGVLTLGAERATDVVINLTGTVTDPTYHITIMEETGGYAVCYQGYDHTAGTEVTLATQLSSGYVGTGVWTVFKEEDGEWVADNSVEIIGNSFIMPAYDIKIQPHFRSETEPCIVVGDYYITLSQSVAEGFRMTGAICHNFTPQGGITVKQYTDATCQVEQTTRWLTITTDWNGTGYFLLVHYETINTSPENRTTYARIEGVTAEGDNVYSDPIEITQLGRASISFGENNQLSLAWEGQSGTIPLVCHNLSGVHHWKVKTPDGGCELNFRWLTLNFVETNDGYEIHYNCQGNSLAVGRTVCLSVWAYDANGNVMGASENWLDGDYLTIHQDPETLISTTRDVYSFDATGATQVYTCPPEGSSFTVVSNQTGSFDYNTIYSPNYPNEANYIELQLSGYVDHAIKGIKLDMMPGETAWGMVQVYVGDLNEQLYYDLAHVDNGTLRSWPNVTYSDECYVDLDVEMNGVDADYVIGSGDVLKIRITSTGGTLYCQGVTVDYVGAPSYVTEKWYETDLEDILPGDEFVIAGYYVFHWYGMDNTNGKAIPLHLSPSNESVLLGIESGSSADFNSVKWTFDRYQGKYLFKPVGTTGQYLKCSTSGDVTIGTGPDNRGFEWSPRPMFNDYYYLYCNGYYLVIDENGDYYNHYWKGFDANHTPGRQTKFFKKTYEYLYDNIATARYQASQADPVVLNVRGVVSHKLGNYLYLQDADDASSHVAIMLRRNDFVNGDDYDQICKGDEIIVRGKPYRTENGYVVAMHNLSLLQVKSQGNTVTPIVVTTSELTNDDGSDPWNTKEFMLVKVEDAVVDQVASSTEFTISQETVQATVSHHTNVEVAQFNEVDVIGVFRRTSNVPELVPRSVNDITVYRPHNVIYGPVIQNESTPDAQYLPVVTLNTESNYSGAYMQDDQINLSFPTSLTTGANDEIFYQYSGVGVYTLDEQDQRTYLEPTGGDASDNRSWIEFTMPNEDVHVEVYYARWYPLRYYKYMNENGTVRLKASMPDGLYPHSGPLYDMTMPAPEGYSLVGFSRGTENYCGDYLDYGVYETGATMLNSDDIWYWPLFQKAGEEELYTMVFVGEQTYGGGEEGLRIGGPTLVAAGAVLDMGDKRINNGANGVKLFIIDDGAQVIYNNNHPFYGTMRKNIVGYGEGTGNWYLLSCPIPHDNVYAENSKIHNLVDNGDYDLYSFDQSENDEWRNFKIDGDNPRWNRGQGVLYASKNGTTVEIEGYLNQSFSGYNVQYDESASFKGFNLVGNPWTYDAYINRTYYRMNAEGTGLVEVTTNEPIHPLEAVFVIATPEDSKVIFTRVPGEFVSQTMTATPQLPLSHDQSEHQDASLVFSLLAGWNWFAPAVETSLETLQTMFGSDAVIGNTSGTIVPGQMVKIYVSEGGEFSITGYASSTNITIEQGTNWIGYLGANNVGIATLFGDDFVPENGDKIISQDGGFAIYTVTEEGSGWSGTLSELQPGKGYIYISNSVDSKTVTIE
ncbi:MAG: hypothetical protein IJ622_02995 [Bacteroidales bacterium]|nr:hypothetical protein [Bacteroidales bacterium]